MKAAKNLPRDPIDTSLSGVEQSARRAAETLDIASLGSKIRGGSGTAGAEGKEGKAGNTWYGGTTVPAEGLGVAGDWYLRTTTSDVYKKTTEKVWTLELNIKGATGAEGGAGKEGPAGAASMNGWKEPCRVATTGNITISTGLNPGDVIDGVTLAENDRVLVWRQTTKKENGIYRVAASPARTTDADAAGELVGGTQVRVVAGTVYEKVDFAIFSPTGSITPGTTEHEWFPIVMKGKTTVAGSGNGWYANIEHKLGKAPSYVVISDANGTFQRIWTADEYKETTFRAGNFRSDGATSTSATCAWAAYP